MSKFLILRVDDKFDEETKTVLDALSLGAEWVGTLPYDPRPNKKQYFVIGSCMGDSQVYLAEEADSANHAIEKFKALLKEMYRLSDDEFDHREANGEIFIDFVYESDTPIRMSSGV